MSEWSATFNSDTDPDRTWSIVTLTFSIISIALAIFAVVAFYTSDQSTRASKASFYNSESPYVERSELGTIAFKDKIQNDDFGETLSIEKGGVGASTAPVARTQLGLGTIALYNSIPFLDALYVQPGTYVYTVPPTVTKLQVRLCGGGGGGGGGGAGGWAITTTPETNYSVIFTEWSDDNSIATPYAEVALQTAVDIVQQLLTKALQNTGKNKAADAASFTDYAWSHQTVANLFEDSRRNKLVAASVDVQALAWDAANAHPDYSRLYRNSDLFYLNWAHLFPALALVTTTTAMDDSGRYSSMYSATVLAESRFFEVVVGPPGTLSMFLASLCALPSVTMASVIVTVIKALQEDLNPYDAGAYAAEQWDSHSALMAVVMACAVHEVTRAEMIAYAQAYAGDAYGPAFALHVTFMQSHAANGFLDTIGPAYRDGYLAAVPNADTVETATYAVMLILALEYMEPNTIEGGPLTTSVIRQNVETYIGYFTEFDVIASATVLEAKRQQMQYIVPSFSAGGGGGGGSSGECSGYLAVANDPVELQVTPGERLTVVVGAGGAGGLGANRPIPRVTTTDDLPNVSNVGQLGKPGGASLIKRDDTTLVNRPGGRQGRGGEFGYQGGDTMFTVLGDQTAQGGIGGEGGKAYYFGVPGEGGQGGCQGVDSNNNGDGGIGGTYLENEYPFVTTSMPSTWFPTLTRTAAANGATGVTILSVYSRGGAGGVGPTGYLSRFGGGGDGGRGGDTRGRGQIGQDGQPGIVWIQPSSL